MVGLLLSTHSLFAQITINNPVLSGFYPDPSVTRVGNDFYLVNSTFSYFPGIPIFHSKDLKNWKQIGNVIDRPTQMNFMGDGVSRGLFAPSIIHHKGIYYVTCTLIDRKGNFVVTSKNPAGPWSNPTWLPEVRGIDPSLFFDSNEKCYIVYNSDPPNNKALYSGHRTIRAYEFDYKNLKVVGDEKLLVNGGVDISKKPEWIEGPHIFKRNNWYYLCAAEGGTSVNHSQVILRSETPMGPYIPYENNPILTQRHLDPNRKNPITSAGHAELVEGPDGKTYALFLAVRPYEGNYYNTGRETFIAPVEWKDGWPIINPEHEEIKYSYSFGFKESKLKGTTPQSGNFAYRTTFETSLDPSLLFLRTLDTSWFKLSKKDGLRIKLKPKTCMDNGQPAFIGKRQQHLFGSASTELNFNAVKENEQAGLLIFQNEDHFYFLGKSVDKGKNVIQLHASKPQTKTTDLIKQIIIPNGEKIYLKIEAKGKYYDFYYALEQNQWKLLKANVDGKLLSTNVAGGFVGSLYALYATSNGQKTENTANFKWLDYTGNDPIYDK
ncbi:Beta-xylosidase [compost metagenome]